jgi:hypothetical protein
VHARGSREREVGQIGWKRARKRFSRTRNRSKRQKTCTLEVLANAKPVQKAENVYARGSCERETGQIGQKRARKKFSRTRKWSKKQKKCPQGSSSNAKLAKKAVIVHSRRSRVSFSQKEQFVLPIINPNKLSKKKQGG